MNMVPLGEAEAATLAEQETIIARGLRTFYEVGMALRAIRDNRLYRQQHGTFEEYCRARWGLGQSQTYRLMDAAEVVRDLASSPIGELPTNESQARPLVSVPIEKRAEVWHEAVNTAPGGRITAAHVTATVERMTAPPPAVPEPQCPPVEDESIDIPYTTTQIAIAQVEPGESRSWQPAPVSIRPQSQAAEEATRAILESGRDDYNAQDFDRLVGHLILATKIAPRLVREVPVAEVARVLTRLEVDQLRYAIPTIEYVLAVYADSQRQKLRVV